MFNLMFTNNLIFYRIKQKTLQSAVWRNSITIGTVSKFIVVNPVDTKNVMQEKLIAVAYTLRTY